jgi:hypothetical protein
MIELIVLFGPAALFVGIWAALEVKQDLAWKKLVRKARGGK